MATVYLALGSNVGDSRGHIKTAIKLLGVSVRGIRRAPIYRSGAVGYTDQPDFLNTAIGGETDLDPDRLLAFTRTVEEKTGRIRRFRSGPREIDIDIIFYDDLVRETEELAIPHPAFRERDFVLRPLCDLDARLKDPVSGRTVRQLLDSLDQKDKSIVAQVD